MKTTTDNHIDKLLHEAMKQRAAKVPPLADDFAEKVMKKSTSLPLSPSKGRGTQSRFSSLSLWRGRRVRLVGAVAASIIVAFFLWPNSPAVVEQPVVAEVVEQPAPEAPKASDYSEVSENSEKSEPSEPVKPKRTYKVRKVSKPIEEPLLAEVEIDEDMEDPFLAIAEQMQDVRSRGEQVRQVVAQLIDNQVNLQ